MKLPTRMGEIGHSGGSGIGAQQNSANPPTIIMRGSRYISHNILSNGRDAVANFKAIKKIRFDLATFLTFFSLFIDFAEEQTKRKDDCVSHRCAISPTNSRKSIDYNCILLYPQELTWCRIFNNAVLFRLKAGVTSTQLEAWNTATKAMVGKIPGTLLIRKMK
jgi:hypothetical protein